jgi:hypothetical protein
MNFPVIDWEIVAWPSVHSAMAYMSRGKTGFVDGAGVPARVSTISSRNSSDAAPLRAEFYK